MKARKLSIARSKQDHIEEARQYASMALNALAEVAAFGEGESMRIQAARELLDRGYGKPAQAEEPPDPKTIEGIIIEPLRKTDGNGHDGPVKLEDWRKLK